MKIKRLINWASSLTEDAHPMGKIAFQEMIQSKSWTPILEEIEKRGGKKGLETKLPVWFPSVSEFNDLPKGNAKTNHTAGNIVRLSGLFMTDYDEKQNPEVEDWRQWYETNLKGRETELGIVLVHISIGGKGIHTLAVTPEATGIADAQMMQALQLGLQHDKSCSDPGRASFAVPLQKILYSRIFQWFGGENIKPMNYFNLNNNNMEKFTENTNSINITTNGEVSSPNLTTTKYPTEYKGIPYSAIIEKWWESHGGVPQEGSCYSDTYKLMYNLRNICESDPEWLLQVVPNYGDDESKWRRAATETCNKPNTMMSADLKNVLLELESEQEKSEENSKEIPSWEKELDAMLKNHELPEALQITLSNVRQGAKFPVLCNMLAIASAYATDVVFDYYDKDEHCQLYSVSVGESAQGKGKYIGKWAPIWCDPMRQADAPAREAEKRERDMSQRDQDRTPRSCQPIRLVAARTTAATLAKRLEDAQGKCLLIYTPELTQLVKSLRSEWGDFSDILLLSYHREGVEKEVFSRKGASCYAPDAAIALAGTCTMDSIRELFPPNSLDDGLFSRVLFSFLESDVNQKPLRTGRVSDEEKQVIYDTVNRLSECKENFGILPFDNLFDEWQDEQIDLNKEEDLSNVRDKMRRRSAVIGVRSAVLIGCMLGNINSPLLPRFFRMMAEYSIATQMAMYQKLKPCRGTNSSLPIVKETRKADWNQLYNEIPSSFTTNDVDELIMSKCGVDKKTAENRRKQGMKKWASDGWIQDGNTKNGRSKVYIKTPPTTPTDR